MEEYISIREAAEKWNVSERRVNQYCSDGRILGAQRIGRSWAIPAGAEKPGDPRKVRLQTETGTIDPSGGLWNDVNLMPLMNTAFVPGCCRQTVERMDPGPRRDIALAEYHYFSGQAKEAAEEAKAYLTSQDMGARLSACLISLMRIFL